jgi:uncharacterized membrane protein YgdD (TMEM256/DUF423 family)
MTNRARAIALAAVLLSLAAVLLAALGSHMVDMQGLQSSWQTASKLHMFNAAALLGLAALSANMVSRLFQWASWLIVVGTIVFCGSIYVHVIIGSTMSGVTPAGGLLMMAGWFLVAVALLFKS